ncbi:MAG: hypothetical protein PVF17_00085 [Ignavibacteria bacterium]|jgi:hypothetical protein
MNFKIGDWVIVDIDDFKSCKPHRIEKFGQNGTTVSIEGIWENRIITKLSIHYNYLTLWQPQKNEWCWFFNNKKEIPKLGKLKYKADNQYTAYMTPKNSMNVQNFKFCEPFIGQLPSILK